MPRFSGLEKFFQALRRFLKKDAGRANTGISEKGLLVFANTSEVIKAERILKNAGYEVSVEGPPPDLQTGCDMVVLFPLLQQAAIEKKLQEVRLDPEKIIAETDRLLSPVSLFHVKDMGKWLMVRAANMKITIDKSTREIVNISGGGCPDVPWLAKELTGKKIDDAPEPLRLGHTLCCYSLQKAFTEIKRLHLCG